MFFSLLLTHLQPSSRAARGDKAGVRDERAGLDLDALYRAHFNTLFRTARALGVSEAQLDDVVQEVFIVALRKHQAFEGRSSPKTWLTGILVNLVRNRRRLVKRPTDHQVDALVEPAADPELTVARGQARDRVLAVLAALPDEQREVWALTELEAMTAAEIAEALDISPNTVSSRLRLARQTIARRLAALRSEGVSP